MRPSTGSDGNTHDNAMDESVLATLACEWPRRRSFTSEAEARTALVTCIEGWYDSRRRPRALAYPAPENVERRREEVGSLWTSGDEHGSTTAGDGAAGATPPVADAAHPVPEPDAGPVCDSRR